MERLAPSARSDPYGSRINRTRSPIREYCTPYASIMVASLLPVLFLAGVMPLMPPLGFLFLIGWRIMRPGVLPLWVGLPLGAFDDLFSGQPFGSGILLWSLTMIALEALESRFPWRGFWQDWFTASLVSTVYILVAMVVSGATISLPLLFAVLPQIFLSILIYPIISRIVAALDQFRLSRSRRIG